MEIIREFSANILFYLLFGCKDNTFRQKQQTNYNFFVWFSFKTTE
ncbi:hypothetical protein HMPREF0645_2333 [Hallella bergensis DSM 17361]|uniref:Lipoprotein n=1 Tax=Hallella bergensis DSM 17361 TaxID=585502 RepID=D1PZE8_9BACT|nr:hypothetical protein HMPREF0645_2333 [Hallella bergensis DSM 17361]